MTNQVITVEENPKEAHIKYKVRYYVAFCAAFACLSSSGVWATFASVTPSASQYYETTAFMINIMSLIFMVAFILFGPLSSYVIGLQGPKVALLIGTGVTVIGATVKWLSMLHPNSKMRYALLLFGQILAAIAQPFILFAPTKLAAKWFPETERTFANSFMSTGSVVGISVVLAYAPAVVKGDPNNIPLLNLIVASTCFLAFLLVMTMPSNPKTPPSTTASIEPLSFTDGLRLILTNKNYNILLLVFGIYVGVFDVFVTLLSDYITPHGYSEQDAGNIGFATVLVGVVSTFTLSNVLDRYPYHGVALKVGIALATLGSALFFIGAKPEKIGFLFAGACIIGMGGFPLESISLELGVESTFPVAEGTSAGLLWISAQFFGIIFMFVSDALRERDHSMNSSLVFNACCLGTATLISFFFVNEGKRNKIDRKYRFHPWKPKNDGQDSLFK